MVSSEPIVVVGDDFDLNRALVALEHFGKRDAIEAYKSALLAATRMHEAMLTPAYQPGDKAAQAQYLALREFENALNRFAKLTVP